MKNNLGNDAVGMAYTIEPRAGGGGAVVRWSDHEVHDAADDFASASGARPCPERDEAGQWLAQFLADGPVPTTEVHAAAAAMGYSLATIR